MLTFSSPARGPRPVPRPPRIKPTSPRRTSNLTTLLALLLPLLFLSCAPILQAAAESLSLDGQWRFRLDPADTGISQHWFTQTLPQRIRLPGALQHQGFGDGISTNTPWTGGIVDRSWFTAVEYAPYRQPGHIKIPFWLQPDKYYTGPAWYQRDLKIPAAWKNKRVVLFLERPHWQSQVWLDGQCFSTNSALGTPHEYDLGPLPPGRHQLTIRIDNRLIIDVGRDSHSVSDHTQGNWNGIAGKIELRATPQLWIEDLQVFPQIQNKRAQIKITLGNATRKSFPGELFLSTEPLSKPGQNRAITQSVEFSADQINHTITIALPLGDNPELWDEFCPALHKIRVRIQAATASATYEHEKTIITGFREISTDHTQFLINGRKMFIRGTLESCIFPLTGYPPTDVVSWRRIISTAKSYGLNNFRFHSWCPPEAAFAAADQLGFYLDVECSSWANSSTTLGDGKPVDSWIYQEAGRILHYYGNHPSFTLMAYGNEPGGKQHAAFLSKWVDHYKTIDPRRLYTSAAGWPQLAENQFHITPDPRIQSWGGGLKTRINARPPETCTDYREYINARSVPIISHEIGQWCVYPNFDEIPKYRGHLRPRNFEIFRDRLNSHSLGDLSRPFFISSGKLQTLCYKEEIESALRTPGMGGFQLLDLHDFPGQGSALVGVVDPFWDPKPYVSAAEYSRFCNSTVPLARLKKRVFTSDETFSATIDLAHFGPAPLLNATVRWRFVDDSGKTVAADAFPSHTIPIGNSFEAGDIQVPLAKLAAPARYKLVVSLENPELQNLNHSKHSSVHTVENDWDFWLYPAAVSIALPPGLEITSHFDEQTLSTLRSGGTVLLSIPPKDLQGDQLGPVALGFSSIFWNTAWTRRQPPHTLGIYCNPKHPLFADFPTDDHTNWQWWYLINRAGAMILDSLPPELHPAVYVIDDWFTARRLGLVLEANVERGKLIVSSIDLATGLDSDPVVRQFLHALLHYASGPDFHPAVLLTPDQIRTLIAPGARSSTAAADLNAPERGRLVRSR